jgi:hypothetical protein
VEFYNRGNWAVSAPVVEADDADELVLKLTCPHPQWVEINRDTTAPDPDDPTIKYLTITEACAVCKSLRVRLLPEGISEKDEPFDFSVPVNISWYERLYNLGNFTILVRRYQQGGGNPPIFMRRVETPAGNVHSVVDPMDTLLFSPSALVTTKDMEAMAKLGPKRYADFRILKEGRVTKPEKDIVRLYGESLLKVVQDIGPESIAAARTSFEGEIEQESAEMEEYQIQIMEKEVAARKAQIEKRRAGKKK